MTSTKWVPAVLTHRSENPPLLLEYRSADWFILSTVSLAVFTDIFLYGMIVPVIPFALESRAGVPSSKVQQWVSILIAVYGAALLAFSPIFGWLADHSASRRSSLLLGLAALTGATVMLNVGSSVGVLVGARVLQGISAAVVWVVGLALLADTVDPKHIAQSMGYVGLSMSLGILVAPLLGGVVFAKGGYNAVYAMAYALIGFDIILRLLLVEKKVAVRWQTPTSAPEQHCDISPPGGSSDPEKADSASVPTGRLSPPPVSASRQLPVQRRHRLPPIISLLASRRLLTSLWGILIQAALMTSFDSVLTIHVQRTFHWDSTGAGLLFLPITIPSFISPIVGWASDKYGPRWFAVAGFLLACPIFVLLRFVTHDSIGQKVLLCVLLAFIGLAITLIMPPLMAEITYVVEAKERARPGILGAHGAYAQAYGLFNMAFAGGCLVGPIWAGFVAETAGWGTMGWTLGLLSGLSAVPAFVWTGGSWRRRRRSNGENGVAREVNGERV